MLKVGPRVSEQVHKPSAVCLGALGNEPWNSSMGAPSISSSRLQGLEGRGCGGTTAHRLLVVFFTVLT